MILGYDKTVSFRGCGVIFVLMVIMLASAASPQSPVAQQKVARKTPSKQRVAKDPNEKNNALESQKLEVERQKLAEAISAEKEKARIEWTKLEFEKSTASRALWTAMVPLLVSLLTIALSVITLGIQVKQQKVIQSLTAELQFEIKAAEIAFAGQTPTAVQNRARLLKQIFPNRLPEEFIAKTFEPEQYGGKIEPSEDKKLFLELMAKYPEQQKNVYDMWEALFEDNWLQKVKPLVSASKQQNLPTDQQE